MYLCPVRTSLSTPTPLKITHTPMILAQEFSRSQVARTSDFSTSRSERGVFWMRQRRRRRSGEGDEQDRAGGRDGESSVLPPNEAALSAKSALNEPPAPSWTYADLYARRPSVLARPSPEHVLTRGLLVAQFAASDGKTLADATELISLPGPGGGPSVPTRLVDAIDLNCGCPQPWAYQSGIGSALLRRPEMVADCVRAVKDRMGWEYPVSVKIRVDKDLKWGSGREGSSGRGLMTLVAGQVDRAACFYRCDARYTRL